MPSRLFRCGSTSTATSMENLAHRPDSHPCATRWLHRLPRPAGRRGACFKVLGQLSGSHSRASKLATVCTNTNSTASSGCRPDRRSLRLLQRRGEPGASHASLAQVQHRYANANRDGPGHADRISHPLAFRPTPLDHRNRRVDAPQVRRRRTRGPYKLWHHTHTFTAERNGTTIRDQIRYALPSAHSARSPTASPFAATSRPF